MILVYFHQSKYRTFKDYYLKEVSQHLRWAFPHLVSYNRFLELMPETSRLLWAYLRTRLGACRGISLIHGVFTEEIIIEHTSLIETVKLGV